MKKLQENIMDIDISEKQLGLLEQAFNVFNNNTNKLQSAYENLQKKVASINKELEEANLQLNKKVMELDDTRKYLKSIHESMSDALIAIDLDGRITTFNKMAIDITGYKKDKIIVNKPLPERLKPIISLLKKSLKDKKFVKNKRMSILIKRNKEIPIDYSISPILSNKIVEGRQKNKSKILGSIMVFRDMSEIVELEERLRKQDKLAALGQMSASVAHEIRNPLNGIEGFAALLKRDFKDDEHKIRMIQNIIDGTRNLNNIVTNLLLYTRPVKLHIRDEKLADIISGALFFLEQEKSLNKRIKIENKIKNCEFKVKVDIEQAKQIALNIMTNSIQAIRNKGKIIISVKLNKKTDRVVVCIKDNGIGIDKRKIKKIFDPFFTTKEQGTGLGLAISQKIVEAHNGILYAESEIGKGTTFFLELPY